MSYDDHTDCSQCGRHSVDCWCYSTNLLTDEAKDDRSAWCHQPDDHSGLATGGVIRCGELGPLLDEGGCSYVIPNRYDPDAVPSPIVSFPRHAMSEEEWRRFERRWRWAAKEQGNALRLINPDGSNGPWSGCRPLWWKRAYYRVRRWLA